MCERSLRNWITALRFALGCWQPRRHWMLPRLKEPGDLRTSSSMGPVTRLHLLKSAEGTEKAPGSRRVGYRLRVLET
jgi:hypothetical protein